MATETVTRLHWPQLRKVVRACIQEIFIARYEAVISTSMLMSLETAFDVHAVFEAYLSTVYSDFADIMRGVLNRIVKRGDYHHCQLFLDFLRRGLDSDNERCLVAAVLRGERAVERMYENETCDGAFPSQHSQHAFTVAVAAVLHLLALVFQYLIGYIDRGGTKTYSSGCFDFRASFVSVLLFLAAFVWIKFRQAAARPSTGKRKQPEHPADDASDTSHVYPRKSGYEARYTIPMNMRDEAHPVTQYRLSLGEYKSREEAAFVWRVAETCYEDRSGTCCVKLGGHQFEFFVPAMSERERGLVGEEKRQSVMKYAKDVGKKEYAKFAMQFQALSTGTGSHDRSPSRRTRQPSLMVARSTYEPLNGLDAPSCSVPLRPPGVEELNAGSQHFQLEHQGPAQGLARPGFPEGVGLKESTDEVLQARLSAFNQDSPPVLGSTHVRNMPFSNSALLEDDNSPVVEAEAATVEHPQSWSLQTFQQGWDARDAVEQHADITGSDPSIVVEESDQLVYFQQQNPRVIQGSESQLVEPSQQMSDRSEEPSEFTPQRYERLRKEKEPCEQKNERLVKEKELAEHQPSLMLADTAHQPLNGLEAPSCSNVPHQPRSVETVGEELNPGWQPTQEQHEVRSQNLQGRVISEGVVSTPCENMQPRSPAMADCDHHLEGGTLDGYRTYSDSAPIPEMPHLGVEAAEQGSEPQSGPLRNFQQGMCPANPVEQNIAFESAVGEQSESEQRTIVQQQQQQPQAIGEEFLDRQQVSESQNPGLQQVYTPSQQTSGPLVEKDPCVTISELLESNHQMLEEKGQLLEENGHLLKKIDRLRKEKELAEQEKKSWRDKYEGLRKEIETFYALARKLL